MQKFKVGDLIIGNEKNPYSLTARGTKWYVRKTDNLDQHGMFISHEMLSYTQMHQWYWVSPEFFDKVNKAPKRIISWL